ncbi:uncharacterized protein MELLADRAFT_124136 [Melampsora larici-populina 98AG31]|uniref:Secreted protein n=1 Tax=Melampsora larici-populina (strain 98AG31 / pathotype 3-4-7) TaxID=747676 RepID=F4RVR1_MELLP|nr:uncharacterized protein MELLADRAFT_124136 [Melampsora larici-populina 98AG31]EGG03541.1 secreted protein [Melampsora larici-populina 98AG31]
MTISWFFFLFTFFHLRHNHFKAFTFLCLIAQFNFHVRAGYSVQDCGLAWAPHVRLIGHPPLPHPGYYCKNSGGVEYGCEVCHTYQYGFWHACSRRPAWGFKCGLQSTSCGYTASDCNEKIICSKGYSYYGIFAHCWDDDQRWKCVPGENGRDITHTICSKCLIGSAASGPPS